jgi:hypothetical protein
MQNSNIWTHSRTAKDIFCFIMSWCMWMPMGTQRGIATWSPAGIYMQYARYSKNSFRFAASTLWNSLPDHFRTENSFSQFKSLLQSWNGSKCRCSTCRWLKFCFWFAYILIFFYFLFLNYFKKKLVWLENCILLCKPLVINVSTFFKSTRGKFPLSQTCKILFGFINRTFSWNQFYFLYLATS